MSYSYHIVHASPKELDVMDTMQQFAQLWDFNPHVRIYTAGLEKAFENPQFLRNFLSHARKKYAKGGRVGIERMSPQDIEEARKAGRFGDTCLAIIGPRTRAAMDMCSPTAGSINPVTGFPEYFDLGSLFDSIGSGLGSIGSGIGNIFSGGNVMDSLKNVGGSLLGAAGHALPGVLSTLGTLGGRAVGTAFGGPMGGILGSQAGGALGNLAGGLGGKIFNQFGQSLSPEHAQSYEAQSMGHGINNFAQNMAQGMPWQQAAGNMINQTAPHIFGQSPVGQGMQNFGQNIANGQGFMPAMQNAYQQTGGMAPAMNAAQHAYNSFQSGSTPLNAVRQGMNQLYQPPQFGPQQQLA